MFTKMPGKFVRVVSLNEISVRFNILPAIALTLLDIRANVLNLSIALDGC